jgi:A/G-specific adenine glycosylase
MPKALKKAKALEKDLSPIPTRSAPDFARRLVQWQRAHGRHGLPWQGTTDPYRVWLSEIMLQQTQVVTVIDYYHRFLSRFPDVRALARASLDEVMALWTGLGYYSRARNLHRCAQQVVQDWGGVFPVHSTDLVRLSGIGPSTAAAIASICQRERVAIFDGNVQRVLARHRAFDGDLAKLPEQRRLFAVARAMLPASDDMPTYTQAIMDLGATVCTPRQAACDRCPVAQDCLALAQGRVSELPHKTRKIRRQSQSWWLLLVRHPKKGVWLQQRPAPGIWAGLYAFPVFASLEELHASLPAKARASLVEHPPKLHLLTHRDLYLHLCVLEGGHDPGRPGQGGWFKPADYSGLGLPKPVRDWLQLAPDDV